MTTLDHPNYRRDLGDNLILRWSTQADTEGLAQLYGNVFRDKPDDPPNLGIGEWTRDMLSGNHPLLAPGDFALVEDTRRGAIVAATCLMHTTWDYDGVLVPVGRPEIVATDPDYRRRGLVRAIFELIHARSDGRGDLAQGITGISYYYRQFGYEYAVELGGYRTAELSAIPPRKPEQPEVYTLHPATVDDLPRLLELYDHERLRLHNHQRLMVSTAPDPAYWRWTLDGQRPASGEGWQTLLIHDAQAQPVGYVLVNRLRWNDGVLGIKGLVVAPGVSYVQVLPGVLRALAAHAQTVPPRKPDALPAARLEFGLGSTHPIYDVLPDLLPPRSAPTYAWYVRVPDLARLLRHLAPVLEQRLATSLAAGHTGELKINFYRGGLRLVFDHGKLVTVEDWHAPIWNVGDGAGFPPLVILQLVWGRRSLAELRYALPDVWANDETTALLNALFPAQPSWVMSHD